MTAGLHLTFEDFGPTGGKNIFWVLPDQRAGIFSRARKALGAQTTSTTPLILNTLAAVFDTNVKASAAKKLMEAEFKPGSGWSIVVDETQNRLTLKRS